MRDPWFVTIVGGLFVLLIGGAIKLGSKGLWEWWRRSTRGGIIYSGDSRSELKDLLQVIPILLGLILVVALMPTWHEAQFSPGSKTDTFFRLFNGILFLAFGSEILASHMMSFSHGPTLRALSGKKEEKSAHPWLKHSAKTLGLFLGLAMLASGIQLLGGMS